MGQEKDIAKGSFRIRSWATWAPQAQESNWGHRADRSCLLRPEPQCVRLVFRFGLDDGSNEVERRLHERRRNEFGTGRDDRLGKACRSLRNRTDHEHAVLLLAAVGKRL